MFIPFSMNLHSPETNSASAHFGGQETSFKGLRNRFLELRILLDGGQPERESGGVVVAPAVGVALDKRLRPELFQTRAWRD